MASAEAIAEVLSNLPDDSDWDDSKAGEALDSFSGSVARAVRSFWAKRAANTADLIDVNESGSSRTLSKKHDNAKAQVAYWDGVIAQETADKLAQVSSYSRKITRV